MTSEFSAASLRSPSGMAGREGLAPMPLLFTGLVFLVAILLRQAVPLNTDVSWLLVVCERMLDGQHLYRDIIEINPPMAAFAYLPGVALARVLGVDPRHVIDAQLLLLAAASLFAVSRILRLSPSLAPLNWGPLAIWAAAVVTILPMHVFAQREHMAMLTFLPALAVYALRSNREPLPLWAILIAGVGAGITLAFKPFFTVPAAFCILFAAIRSRSWLTLLAPENIIAAVLVISVSVGTYVFYPEYFTVTYPLVRDTYLSWSMPVSVIFLNDATLVFAIAMVSVLLARQNRTSDPLLLVAVLAAAGFAISFFLQRRGWAYHSYPMVAVALLAMGYALTAEAGSRSRRAEALSALVLAVAFSVGMHLVLCRRLCRPDQASGRGSQAASPDTGAERRGRHRSPAGAGYRRRLGFPPGESLDPRVRAVDARKDLCRRGDRRQAERLSGARAQMADRGLQEAAA